VSAKGEQLRGQPIRARRQHRRALALPLAARALLRQLLRHQFLDLQPQPRGMAAIFQRGQAHLGRGAMEKPQRLADAPQGLASVRAKKGLRLGRQRLAQIDPVERGQHRLAYIGLGQARRGRIHGGERVGQRPAGGLELRMHHRVARQAAAAQFATHAHQRAHRPGLLLGGIEVEEAQHATVAPVTGGQQPLAPTGDAHLAGGHLAFKLDDRAVAALAQRHQAGFVLVAQRQVQRQVDGPRQAELAQRLLRAAQGLGGGCRRIHAARRASCTARATRWRATRGRGTVKGNHWRTSASRPMPCMKL
jgi:hypothetical protein